MKSTVKRLLSSTSLIISIAFLGISEKTLASRDIFEESKSQETQISTLTPVASSSVEDASSFQVTPSLPTILKELTTQDVPVLERAKKHSPLKLLNRLCEELRLVSKTAQDRDQHLYDLVVNGMWALRFHYHICHEIPQVTGKKFLSILLEVTETPMTTPQASSSISKSSQKKNQGRKPVAGSSKASHKLFSHVPNANSDQRALLRQLYEKDFRQEDIEEILMKFFGSTSAIISKPEIENTLRVFKSEYRTEVKKMDGSALQSALALFSIKMKSEVYREKGNSEFKRGNNDKAQQYYEKGVALNDVESMVGLGDLAYLQNNEELARNWYGRAVELGGKYKTVALRNLGVLAKRSGDLLGAKRYFSEGVVAGDIDAMLALGEVEEEQGNIFEARRLYKKAIALRSASGMFHLGLLEAKQGNREAAETNLRGAVDQKIFEANLGLAEVLWTKKKFVEAEALLKDAMRFGVKDTDLYYIRFLVTRYMVEKIESYGREALACLEAYEEGLPEAGQLEIKELRAALSAALSARKQRMLIFYPAAREEQPEKNVASVQSEVFSSDHIEKNQIEDTSTKHQAELLTDQDPAPSSGWQTSEDTERYVIPSLSKRLERYFARAMARKQEEDEQGGLSRPKRQEKTYQDVEVKVQPKAEAIIHDHKERIQGFISRLANGEKPNNFKKLEGYDDIYSMRLARVGRVILRIPAWNGEGVSALTLLSVDDHYETLESVAQSTTEPQLMQWE